MAVIHVEPEQMQQHGKNLILAASTIVEQLQAMSASKSRLEMGWQSSAASLFLAELEDRMHQMEQQAEQMHTQGMLLIRQAELWLELDQRWTAAFASMRSKR
jgi:uncharacterized protein YukE